MRTIEQLVEAVHREAIRAEFPVDEPVYRRAGKDPWRPILFAGSLEAPLCVFARDLGKDEVSEGEPLIGAGGRLVREGLYRARHGAGPPRSDRRLESALADALLTNTVPYKPPGNKAYPAKVKERFRPFLAELLGDHWRGRPRHHARDRGVPAGSPPTPTSPTSRSSGGATTATRPTSTAP